MQLTLQIVITDESGSSRTEELMTIQKSGETRNDIGLSVSESKLLLNTVQQSVVQLQADEYTQHHIRCPHCLAARRIKGKQKIRYRTLFGVIPVSGLRVYRCRCEESDTKTVSLLSDWAGDYSHPALKYIETRWASMISYEMTTRLLKDILPVGHSLNASTVRNHLCQVAQLHDIRVEAIYENSTLKAPFCISGHGMPGATAADEFDKTLAFLEAIVNADDETTVGEIRPFADDLDAVRFNRHKINRQLSRLDLASPVLEPEVIWLGRRR